MTAVRKKILIIGSYPIAEPRHGGQKRAHAIVTEYRKHFSDVRYVGVFSRWANPTYARTDIPVSHQTDRVIRQASKLEDIVTGEAIDTEPKVSARLTKLLRSYRPDIIQVEQIYVYLGLKPLLEKLGLNPILIFDAHNVESAMKRKIYEDERSIYHGSDMDRDTIDQVIARLVEAETDLVQRAALTIAVSKADYDDYANMGAKRLALAPNGIYRARTSSHFVRLWQQRFASQHLDRTFLYVASAHMPNWTGFLDVVGQALGFLPPNARILFAGGLADYLSTRHDWHGSRTGATFWLRAEGCGILSEVDLGSLITASDVIILPINSGGGSNLKTAEALLSGKPVIATKYAFRAYEQFMDLPTVTIADDADGFRAAMTGALVDKPVELSKEQSRRLEALTWPHTLDGLIKEVASL